MPLESPIPEGSLEHLNGPGQSEFHAAAHRYCIDLLAEAGRLEATAKTTSGNPEITSSMVKDADLLLRHGYRRPKRTPFLVVAQVVSTIGSFVTGLLFDTVKLKEPGQLVFFIIVLAISITATVITVVKE